MMSRRTDRRGWADVERLIYYFAMLFFALLGFAIGRGADPSIDAESLDLLGRWAVKFCRAAKNMSRTLASAVQRREWVTEQLEALCERLGLKLTGEQIRAILEAAYDEMMAADSGGGGGHD